jgi:hypothetical protein
MIMLKGVASMALGIGWDANASWRGWLGSPKPTTGIMRLLERA